MHNVPERALEDPRSFAPESPPRYHVGCDDCGDEHDSHDVPTTCHTCRSDNVWWNDREDAIGCER